MDDEMAVLKNQILVAQITGIFIYKYIFMRLSVYMIRVYIYKYG
jgi:hypothetical protein